MIKGQYKSAQSALLGLPMLGASCPTSLQKFHDSNPTLMFWLFIPGSPIAEMYMLGAASKVKEGENIRVMRSRDGKKEAIFATMEAI